MPERVHFSISPELLASQEEHSLVKHASQAFLHSLIQSPINGVVQISDHAFDKNALPSVQFIAAPREAQFGTKEWHAQQIGQAAGMLPWLIGLHRGSGALIGRVEAAFARTAARAEAQMATRLSEGFLSRHTAREVGASALSGLTYGALLSPSKPGEDLLRARAVGAASSALTFATLGATMRGLETAGLRSQTMAGIVSGVPAGFVAAESHSLLSGKGLASLADVGKSVYGFSMIGGGFGFVQGRIESRLANENQIQSQSQNRDLPSVSRTESQTARPAPPKSPADLTAGHTIVVQRDGVSTPLEVVATTERMVVVREPQPLMIERVDRKDAGFVSERFSVRSEDLARYSPIEVIVDGKPQTRYISSSETQIRSNVYRAEQSGSRIIMNLDPGFSAVNRPEMFLWADTPRVRAGADGLPAIDWSIAREMRAESKTGQVSADPKIVRGESSVRSGAEGRRWDQLALRVQGDTHASLSSNNGTVVLERPGQPWVAEMTDGRSITMESPGPWEVATPHSRRVIQKDADGHVEIKSWEGETLHIIRNPNAPQYVIILGTGYPEMKTLPRDTPPPPLSVCEFYPSSTGVFNPRLLSDGTRLEYNRSGAWEGIRPDGSRFTAAADGPWQIIDAGGFKFEKDSNGVLTRSREGSDVVHISYPDGTRIERNSSGYAGKQDSSIRYTEVSRPGEPLTRTYEDPAVPGQTVTNIHRVPSDHETRINTGDYDWEAVSPSGERFTYDSPGPWEVSLPSETTISKDAAGNLTMTRWGNTCEHRVNGDRVYIDSAARRVHQTDGTILTLYHGSNRWVRSTPLLDGTRIETYIPVDPPTPAPAKVTTPIMGDPFSNDYW